MNNIFKTLGEHFKNTGSSVNTGRRLKHAVFIAILAVATIMMIAPKYQKADEETVVTEDPIESYDTVVEIAIGDDGAVVDTEETEETDSETVGG